MHTKRSKGSNTSRNKLVLKKKKKNDPRKSGVGAGVGGAGAIEPKQETRGTF